MFVCEGGLRRILFNSVNRLRKEKINQGIYLFYSRLSPNLTTALETIKYCPPCAFHWFPACHIHPPSLPRVFGWLLCLLVDWGPPKTTTKFVPRIYSVDWADSQLVDISPHPLEAIENQGPEALPLFIFLSLYSTPPNDG